MIPTEVPTVHENRRPRISVTVHEYQENTNKLITIVRAVLRSPPRVYRL